MALQHFLWVLWTGCLLDCGLAWPYRAGYTMPNSLDWQNLAESNEDMELLNYDDVDSISYDFASHQAQPSGGTHSISGSTFVVPNQATPYRPAEEELINNPMPVFWEVKNPEDLLVFPLKTSEPARGTGEWTSVSAPEEPPGAQAWKPSEFEYDHARRDLTEAPPHLVFEQVFQMPPENEVSRDATEVGRYQSRYPAGGPTEKPREAFDRSHDEIPKPVGPNIYQETKPQSENLLPSGGGSKAPQSRTSDPIFPPIPRYVIQSRAGYGRVKQYYENTKYTPHPAPSYGL